MGDRSRGSASLRQSVASKSVRARPRTSSRPPGPIPPDPPLLKVTSTHGNSPSPLALSSTDPAVVAPMAVQSHGVEFVLARAPSRAESP
ncbi:hypothetical protein [Streptomyces murinus]|uniref:hypothetical protein n=1 Tax=Streptomyces murinus TaxID=33900 RepID=UPI00380AC53A